MRTCTYTHCVVSNSLNTEVQKSMYKLIENGLIESEKDTEVFDKFTHI